MLMQLLFLVRLRYLLVYFLTMLKLSTSCVMESTVSVMLCLKAA